jgi:selenocysteine lyase/cysteine desulfurase
MPSTLYLDAARMGRMAPSAQLAMQDFVRLAGEEGCTLYFERFFKDGFSALLPDLRARLPGLNLWRGVAELKAALAAFVGLSPDCRPYLAGRSTNLMKLAARFLFRGGKRILSTDLTWPSYAKILNRERSRTNGSIERLRIHAAILGREISGPDLVEMVVKRFVATNCAGVFLPAMTHDGIRLPIADLIHALRKCDQSAFIVVDGSQALGHAPVDLSETPCDFYLGGCHKWLGSPLPLGIAFCPNPTTRPHIDNDFSGLIARGKLDDPLLAFLQCLEEGKHRRFTETVNLSPLFACRGALEDHAGNGPVASLFARRQANAKLVRRIAPMTGWTPLVPDEEFSSACVLLRTISSAVRVRCPSSLRERFHERGIALTCYDGGIVRVAMPSVPLSANEVGRLIQALALVNPHVRYFSADKCEVVNG